MNKTAKIILIIAICAIPVGIIFTVIGVSLGGKIGWSLNLSEGKIMVSSDTVTKTEDLDDFDALDLEISTADVNIMRGDAYRIEYKTREGKEPVITQENGKLSIKQPAMGFEMFHFGFGDDGNTYTITIPENSKEIDLNAKISTGDLMLDRIKVSGVIDASTSDILLNDIEGKELAATVSSGDIDGDKVKVSKVTFKGSTSDINMLRLYSDDVYTHTSTGDIDINDSAVSNLRSETSTGDVTIQLNGKEDDYSYDFKVSTGDIVVNGTEYEKNYTKDNGSDRKIDINTSTGDINVTVN